MVRVVTYPANLSLTLILYTSVNDGSSYGVTVYLSLYSSTKTVGSLVVERIIKSPDCERRL